MDWRTLEAWASDTLQLTDCAEIFPFAGNRQAIGYQRYAAMEQSETRIDY